MSCQFKPKGNTVESCFNKCQEVNTGDCSTYCTNTCNECSDSDVCKWLMTNNQKDIDALKSNYDELTKKIIEYQKREKAIWNTNDIPEEESNSIHISLLQNITQLKQKRKIIWEYLKNEYQLNTQLTDSNNKVLSRSNKLIKSQNNTINKTKEVMDSLNNLSNTKKRQIEINLYKYKKSLKELRIIKWSLILLVVLFIIPILLKTRILYKKISIIIYGVIALLWIIVVLIYLYFMNTNRDDNFWNDYNFKKPDPSNISQDSISGMSESEKQKCLAMSDMIKSEEFDPNDVDIGNVHKFVNNPKTCTPL
jgi:heme/copper-type cytochrome/quinol oxidase subunit 4